MSLRSAIPEEGSDSLSPARPDAVVLLAMVAQDIQDQIRESKMHRFAFGKGGRLSNWAWICVLMPLQSEEGAAACRPHAGPDAGVLPTAC